MKTEFVSYNQSVQLRELGFDEICFTHYWGEQFLNEAIGGWMKNSNTQYIMAPLKQQVFRWFRDNHNLFGCIDLQCSNPAHWYIRVDNIIENDFVYHSEDYRIKYKTYEEAESACIDKLIELVKNK